MTAMFFTLLCGLGVIIGALIGSVGIGGVLLVPALVYLGGIEVHAAVAIGMWAFLFSGAVATLLYARRGSIDWRAAIWLCAGAVPAAFAGALAMSVMPGRLLELLIALLVAFAGANALLRRRRESSGDAMPSPAVLVAIGALTGFGSALSGTGGALILLPILVWLGVSGLAAVGLVQVIQIPIAGFATIGNLASGYFDPAIGSVVAATLVVGVVVGARAAHAISARALERGLAVVLVATGAFLALRLAAAFMPG